MPEQVTRLEYFETLVAEDEHIPLLETAASLAQDENPGLDLQQVLSGVDIFAKRLADRCRHAGTEFSRLQITLDFFYRELGFSGNINDYYSPDNSFIHKVIETRRGIPISLAVVFVELARHVGLDAYGVSFPGHFLVGVNMHDGAVVLDPFTGTSLSYDALQERLEPFRVPLGLPRDGELPTGKFLNPAGHRDVLLRMLNNLREIYQHQDQPEKLKRVQERLDILERAAP